jgi:hypothetical protein
MKYHKSNIAYFIDIAHKKRYNFKKVKKTGGFKSRPVVIREISIMLGRHSLSAEKRLWERGRLFQKGMDR